MMCMEMCMMEWEVTEECCSTEALGVEEKQDCISEVRNGIMGYPSAETSEVHENA